VARAGRPLATVALAVVAGAAVLGACGDDTADGIEERHWFLVALGDAVDPIPADPGRLATALFEDGGVTGDGPCSAYSAPYQLSEEEGTISVGDIATTRARCGEPGLDDQETRYFTYLPMAQEFTVDHESLRIVVEGDRVLLFREDVGDG
jgi:heat shock protein HslJ